MEDVSKLKVGVLRDRLAALGEDSSGVKKVLVERLQQALASGGAPAAGATAAAPMVLDDDDNLNPSKMKVGELRDELAKRGADSSGTKPVLVARLEGLLSAPAAAGKRPASPPAAAADPAAKKPKGKQKAIVAKWFWAGDAKWNPYDGDQIEKLEAALEAGDGKCDVSADHFVDLSSSGRAGATGKTFVQRRAADPTRSRIVVRQSDGLDPAIPIPQVVGAPKTATIAKSGVIPAAAASAGGSGPAAVKKSVGVGGVQKASYGSYGAQMAGGSGKSTQVKQVVKGRAAVDASCPRADECHVYEERDDVYDALLNQTNIANNNNKYYIIQLLETDDGSRKYFVWLRWGRVGEERGGQNQCIGPMDLPSAKKEFEKKFHDKTKNRWSNRDQFQVVSGKYTLLHKDYGADADAAAADDDADGADGTGEAKKPVESALDTRVQSFMALISDISMMKEQMREIGFDAERMPLGKLQKRTILEAYKCLQQLSQILVPGATISGGGGGASSAGAAMSGGSMGGGGVAPLHRGRIEELSNGFYSLIPHVSSFADGSGTRARLPWIDTPAKLKEKIEMVEALGNIELAQRVISPGKGSGFDVHPIDAKYNSLGTRLTPIDKGGATHAMLAEYIANTHAATHNTYSIELVQAFEVQRDGEAAAFKDVGNRQLLWHGSRLTNWCGILSTGLRIAPPEAPVTGYMFGKGVYFADMVSKSANYCFATSANPDGVLLLSEVALGTPYEKLRAEYEADASCRRAGKGHTWGKGKTAPDPAGARTLPGDGGLKVPMGKGKPTDQDGSSLLYNEFIVYDTQQIKQKYVLRVKFKFQQRY